MIRLSIDQFLYRNLMSVLSSSSESTVLFEAIARGEENAYKALFEKYSLKVYAVALKWTKSAFAAEEITQDVFISIWISRTMLSSVKDPQAYIYTIIYNKVNRYLKKETNTARILVTYLRHCKKYCNETEETVYAKIAETMINNAVEKLSPHKKLLYKLNRQQGKSYDEIALQLKLSPHTVKSQVMKAVKFIRVYIKDNALLLTILLAQLVY